MLHSFGLVLHLSKKLSKLKQSADFPWTAISFFLSFFLFLVMSVRKCEFWSDCLYWNTSSFNYISDQYRIRNRNTYSRILLIITHDWFMTNRASVNYVVGRRRALPGLCWRPQRVYSLDVCQSIRQREQMWLHYLYLCIWFMFTA